MAERFKALVSKTSGVLVALVGSNPTPSAIFVSYPTDNKGLRENCRGLSTFLSTLFPYRIASWEFFLLR